MPPRIIIVGLGPGDPEQLTLEAHRALCEAGEVYVRTSRHPTIPHLPGHLVISSFDHIYEEKPEFAQVYDEISRQVIALAQRDVGVCYAVPGDPMVAEATVQRLLSESAKLDLPLRIVSGLSFVEPTLAALGIDLLDGLQVLDAIEVGTRHHPPLNPDLPALLGQLYSRAIASDVKLTLMNLYPNDHRVHLVIAAGTGDQQVLEIPLYELDRQESINHLCSLYIPPLPRPGGLNTFLEIVAHLRSPEGCPWDQEQTHQTLRSTLLEETYEVLATLDDDDPRGLCEELGDLLLQIVLHTQIAVESSEFKMPDVAHHIIAKMRRRHPHVFAEVEVSGSAQVIQNWEKIKAAEREGKAQRSLLSGIPAALPSLARARALQERAARVGFDWPDIEGVIAKIREEVRELVQAHEEQKLDELGDLLFSIVNLARWLAVDAEDALRTTSDRFSARFQTMEKLAAQAGQSLQELSLEEQDALWKQAKIEEQQL